MDTGRHDQSYREGGNHLAVHAGEQKPFWFEYGSPASPSLVLPAAPAVMQFPALSGLPSSLPWEEGRWAGEAYRTKFSHCLETAANAFQKLGLEVPEEVYETQSVHSLYQYLRTSVLESAGITEDDEGRIQFCDEYAEYSLMDEHDMFYGVDLSWIDTSELSETGKAAYFGIASLLINVSNLVHVLDYTEPAVDWAEEEQEEEDTVYLHEGQLQVEIEDFMKDVREMKELRDRFAFVPKINPDTVDQLIEDSDLAAELKSSMLEFASLIRSIGPFDQYDMTDETQYDDNHYFAGYLFYITCKNDNYVTELYFSSVWEQCMNCSVSNFSMQTEYTIDAFARAKLISSQLHRFRELFALLIFNIPHKS